LPQLLHADEEALDAAQDVFVRLIERRHRLDGQYPSSLPHDGNQRLPEPHSRSLDASRRRRRATTTQLEAIACARNRRATATRGCSSIGCSTGIRCRAARSPCSITCGLTLEQVAEQTGMSVSGVRKREEASPDADRILLTEMDR
jgi:hypothetical protein